MRSVTLLSILLIFVMSAETEKNQFEEEVEAYDCTSHNVTVKLIHAGNIPECQPYKGTLNLTLNHAQLLIKKKTFKVKVTRCKVFLER